MVDVLKRSRRRRWVRRIGIGLFVGVIAFYFLAPSTVGWIIGHNLRNELASRMNAKLDFSRVIYRFPYGVRVEKAHLLIPGENGGGGSSIDFGRLDLTLAKLPLGDGPLVIEKLAIDDPVVRLTSNPPATVIQSTSKNTPQPAAAGGSAKKISDLFQLRQVVISNGQFAYDFSRPGHPQPPLVWGNLNITMTTLPTSGGNYSFTVAVADPPLAAADISGAFDIDALKLNLQKVHLVLACEPNNAPAQMAPQALSVIHHLQIGGRLTLDGNVMMPLQSMEHTTGSASISIDHGHCVPPGWTDTIRPTEFTLTATNSSGPFTFNLVTKDGAASAVTASGSIDFKTLMLDVGKLVVSTDFDPRQISNQVPTGVATAMHKLGVGGRLTLTGCVRMPMNDPLRGLYAASVELTNGQCQPPGWTSPITPAVLSIASSNIPGAAAKSLPSAIELDPPARPSIAHLWVENLSAVSGNQLFKIQNGEVDYDPVKQTWIAQRFRGKADFGDGPGPVQGANSRFILPFFAAGDGKIGEINSNLRIAVEDGDAVVTQNHLLAHHINGMLTATPDKLMSTSITGSCALGQIKAAVDLYWNNLQPGTSLTYDGELQIDKLDLHQLAMQYTTDPALRQKAFGELQAQIKCRGSIREDSPASGTGSPADLLEASGDVDITNGYFVNIPVLRDIVTAMSMGNVATVGEAAATFDINHRVINFARIGASSPALGIQGSGTLSFDMQTSMVCIATPLGDWGKGMQGAGLLGQAGAAIVGKVQDVVNGVQRAIYQFRVTGDISSPDVKPVVVPFVTDQMTQLFQKMAANQNQGNVAAELKK